MKVRYKKDNVEGFSNSFNTHGMSEVIVNGDWGADSAFIKDLDILIGNTWKDLAQAFKDSDIIPDNHNEHFALPINEECKKRGYNP